MRADTDRQYYIPVPIIEIDNQRMKICSDCETPFPIELNRLGQMTSRKLCDDCRSAHASKRSGDLPVPPGVQRCVGCTALVGAEWGTVTHLDENGRCYSCAAWELRRLEREEKLRAGLVNRGGTWVKNTAPAVVRRTLKQPSLPDRPMSVQEVARLAKVSRPTVITWIRQKKLPAWKDEDNRRYWIEPGDAKTLLAGRPVSPQPITPKSPARIPDNVGEILDRHGVTENQLFSRSRKADIVACRAEIAAYWCERGLSLSEIAMRVGVHHHTVVLNLLETWRRSQVGGGTPGFAASILSSMYGDAVQ